MSALPDLRPMSDFDPTRPAIVYDEINDRYLRWRPIRWAESYSRDARRESDGIVNWDGLHFAGWLTLDHADDPEIASRLR